MATTDARGTKRTCQNSECGSRFYDLNRSPIVCPICEESYVLPSGGPVAKMEDDARKVRKSAPVDAAEPVADVDADDALISLEEADAEVAGDDDETFLEEEEEAGGDVTDIVGGATEGDEEP